MFWLNSGAFEPFRPGIYTAVTSTFGVWSNGCGPRPNFFSYLLLIIGYGHDTLIVWYQLVNRSISQSVNRFFLYLRTLPALSGTEFEIFLGVKMQGGYNQFSTTFEPFLFNSPHFCLNPFSWIYSWSYAQQWLYVTSVNYQGGSKVSSIGWWSSIEYMGIIDTSAV